MARPRWSTALLPLAGLLASLAVALAAPEAGAREKLVPANTGQMNRTDGRGFNWDPTTQGVIRDGTSDCFDDAIRLKINGGDFNPNKPAMQTRDGSEFVLQGVIGQIEVTRRIKIDSDVAAVRCVETLTNTSKRAVRVSLEIWSMLGGSANASMTDLGRPIVNGPLQKGETSIFAIQAQGGRPSVIFQLRGPRTKITPVVNVQHNRTYSITWSVNIPAGKSTSILHALVQRRYQMSPNPKKMAEDLKPMFEPKWLAGLPTTVRSSVMNHDTMAASAEGLTQATPAHQEVLALAKAYEVERGEKAVLFIEREKPLVGGASGEALTVSTRMGPVEVPLEDVAVLRGGAGVGRSMRLFLRDGEILAGDVVAPALRFQTSSGLEIPLDPSGIDALFLPEAEHDGKVAEETEAFLTQLDGTKLSLVAAGPVVLDAVSPWGDLEIPLEDVIRIRYARDPLPGLWILLRNGSRFPLAVRGATWRLKSRRFGDVEVAPGSIAAWSRHGVAPDMTKGDDDEVTPTTTHLQLAGGCFLVGGFAQDSLTVETIAGATPVDATTIRQIERGDETEGGTPTFTFQLLTGEAIQGRLQEPLVTFTTPRGICRVPVLHLWAYRWSPPATPSDPEGPDEPADPEGKDDDGKKADPDGAPDGDGNDAPAKDAPAKDAPAKKAPAKAAPAKGGK